MHLLALHRTRDAPDCFDMHCPSHGFLTAGKSHERPVPFGNMSESRIRHFLNGVLALSEMTSEDEIFVKGRNGCEGAIDGGRRETGRRSPVISGGREHLSA